MTAFARIARPIATPAEQAPPPFRPRRPADRGARLAHALAADALRLGCRIAPVVVSVEPWSSATFNGSIIVLTLELSNDPDIARWLAELPERDIPLGRDIVADIAVEPYGEGWRLRALLCLDAANG